MSTALSHSLTRTIVRKQEGEVVEIDIGIAVGVGGTWITLGAIAPGSEEEGEVVEVDLDRSMRRQ